jgi:TRAP-type C4-dicarboxylate transport system permease small subunit
MQTGLDRWIAHVERAVVWISYGVFTRYVLDAPDRMVTEATALLLFPVAFAGLAYAMREDAYPKVTMLTDTLPPLWRKAAALVNLAVMLGVGLFFSLAGVSATIRSYNSGASSEILLWPRFAFWAPGALALLLFSLYATLRLIKLIRTPAREV